MNSLLHLGVQYLDDMTLATIHILSTPTMPFEPYAPLLVYTTVLFDTQTFVKNQLLPAMTKATH